MSPILIATFGGLATAICWGTADWLVGKISKRVDVFEINFTVQVLGAAVIGAFLIFTSPQLPNLSQTLQLGFASMLIAAGFILFVKALSSGSVGIVVPLSSMYPLITLVLSILFLGAIFKGIHLAAMMIIMGGAVALAYEKNHQKIPLKELHRETLLALTAALFWGIGFFAIDPLVEKLAWQALVGIMNVFMAIAASLLLIYTHKSETLPAVKRALTNKKTLLVGIIYAIASVALYMSSEYANSLIIPLVLSATGPLVASVLAAVVDKENIGFIKRIGAGTVIAGIILLNIS